MNDGMRNLFFTFIFLSVTLAGCTKPPEKALPDQTLSRSLPGFTQIEVEGDVNVQLHTGYRQPRIILRGSPSDLKALTAEVTQGTLRIVRASNEPHPRPIQVEIRSRHLNALRYQGNGRIKGERLRSSLLDLAIENAGQTTLGGHLALRNVEICGSGAATIKDIRSNQLRLKLNGSAKVKLIGVTNLTHLSAREQTNLSLHWVKSKHLVVRAYEQAQVQLAGVADTMDVKLYDESCFNGRYLRAKRAFVKTFGKSVAQISALSRQHTLASDFSDIQFYALPEMRADFMAFDGSVLDSRDFRSPFLEQQDRYNK